MKLAGLILCILGLAIATPIEQPGWRIIGGDKAADGQFPHQISLRDGNFHICGGSILDETTILCAAHCVAGGQTVLNVVTGTNKLNSGGDRYKVKSVKIHEGYNLFLHQDISILKLESPIKFSDKVQPIKLRQSYIEESETAILSGWGSTNLGDPSPNDLQFINLKTLSYEQCRKDQTTWVPVLENQLCTFTKSGEGACQGDSGGPLIDENGEQIGIVSWGTPCARGKPDVFTRVYSYLDWIETNK